MMVLLIVGGVIALAYTAVWLEERAGLGFGWCPMLVGFGMIVGSGVMPL